MTLRSSALMCCFCAAGLAGKSYVLTDDSRARCATKPCEQADRRERQRRRHAERGGAGGRRGRR